MPKTPNTLNRFALIRQAAVLAAIVLLGVGSALAETTEATSGSGGSGADSARVEASRLVASSREAYQAAWAQRQSNDHKEAVQVADRALAEIEPVLKGDLDVASRRELVELKVKLEGLRDASRGSIEDASRPADAPADSKILNQPAIEEMEPQFNGDVHRYIEYFTGGGRSVFERWLKRSGRYMDLFREVLRKEGLPPDLVHLVFVESGFNVHARSYASAVGPWQFLRSTARMFGLTVNQWVDERKDPEKSTVAAARYLKHLYSIFGDWPLALASYNAGEGTVLRAIKRQGTTNYWDLRLPRQTEEYVPQFMAILAISRDPQKYGFADVELEGPMNFDELALKGAVDLRALAKISECTYEELRDLNPAVLRHAVPSKDGVTTVRVPRGKAEVILQKLEGGAPMPAVDLTVRHRVRRGETIQGIANQYHVSATQLAKSNGLTSARPLKRGMVLTVRAGLKPRQLEPAGLEPSDPRGSTAYVPSRKIGTPARLKGDSNGEGRLTVTVRRGQTLGEIAKAHGVTTADLMRWNHLKSSTVRRGTRLKVRNAEATESALAASQADSVQIANLKPPRSKKSSARAASRNMSIKSTIIVRSGDTLSEIAARNGTTVTKLKRANGMSSSRVRAGQKLRIPA